ASALTPIAAEIAAKIKSFFIGEAVSSGAIERSRTVTIRLVLLAFLFLFFALLVLLQELPVCINFDAPLLALFVYHGFVNGFTFLRLLLDLHDLVTASFIFDCRLHRRGQIGHLDSLLVFLLGGKDRRTSQTGDYGDRYCCDYFLHLFRIYSSLRFSTCWYF